ncbi:hypothetical protein RHSIM_Rhsim13G0011900 [Rhododendron simsii]|uniref:DNA mismatch repair protein S5 domain-containing protein n=1 Tax=Rhododendron simsii TaxID=118357 RepID=A0A834FYT2_RHOSS|nr:hypothetical protein RHSIM_Rhsim13G0011900 [Rhododendron simsii]
MDGGAATPAVESPTIRPINKGVVHRICAGQVILDLSSAVKELVENSLDAGATSIEIALREYGEESFQVIDNGCGISPNNFKPTQWWWHYSDGTDNGGGSGGVTLLWRGRLADRTLVEAILRGFVIVYYSSRTRIKLLALDLNHATYTIVQDTVLENLLADTRLMVDLAYALIAKGVRLVCTNTTGKNVKSVVLKTQGSGSLKDNIITVFGTSTFSCLEPVNMCVSDSCKVDGYLSRSGNGSGRNLGDRQFFFVNGRPVDMPKVGKLVNEIYKGANSRQYPIAIMNFIVPSMACDVNLTPDKRKVLFSDEVSVLHSLREALGEIYSLSHSTRPEKGITDPPGAMGTSSDGTSTGEEFTVRAHGTKKADGFFGHQNEQYLNSPTIDQQALLHSEAIEKGTTEMTDSPSHLNIV